MNTNTDGVSAMSAKLGPLLDSEEDPARLWAEIHLLRAAMQGPDGYLTWHEAAVAERVRRVRAERALAAAIKHNPPAVATSKKPAGWMQRFDAWRERTGFFTDGPPGGF